MQGTTIQDIYEARMVTEPVCAGMLANARTDQDLADLRERAKQLRTAFTRMPRFAY